MNLRTFGGSDGDVRMVVSSADAAAGSSRTRATSKSIRGSLSELHVVMFAKLWNGIVQTIFLYRIKFVSNVDSNFTCLFKVNV